MRETGAGGRCGSGRERAERGMQRDGQRRFAVHELRPGQFDAVALALEREFQGSWLKVSTYSRPSMVSARFSVECRGVVMGSLKVQ